MTDKPKPWTRSKLRKIDLEVGRSVRETRQLQQKSQEWLAAQLGISFQQVQKYEKGMNRISASRLVQIGFVLGRSPGAFFEGIDR